MAGVQQRSTLKDILSDAWEQRRQESSRRGSKGDQQGADNGKIRQDKGQRHWRRVTFRGAEDLVQRVAIYAGNFQHDRNKIGESQVVR